MKRKNTIKFLTAGTLAVSLLVPTLASVQVNAATTTTVTTASKTTDAKEKLIKSIDYNFVQDVMETINDPAHLKDRKYIAKTLGIKDYKDTTAQKFELSKLVRDYYNQNAQATKNELIQKINSNYKGNSIVDYLKSAKQPSNLKDRKLLAEKLKMFDYNGTASQNLEMLEILRSNGK